LKNKKASKKEDERMALRIAHNIASINAWRQLTINSLNLRKTMEKLSSGYRINRGADNPAGLSISQKMRSQIAGLNQAIENTEIAINMIQTAEGALNEIHNLLVDMRRLAVHAANAAPNDYSMREADQRQIEEIINTIDRIATQTKFGSKRLLNGIFTSNGTVTNEFGITITNQIWDVNISLSLTDPNRYVPNVGTDPWTNEVQEKAVFHVGADAYQTVFISIASVTANRLGYYNNTSNNTNAILLQRDPATGNMVSVATALNRINVTTTRGANIAIGTISLAIGQISRLRSQLGAFQKYILESNAANLRIAVENLTESESTIRDTDMAKEMAEFTKHQILLQTATAMLAQANLIPQAVLQLLK